MTLRNLFSTLYFSFTHYFSPILQLPNSSFIPPSIQMSANVRAGHQFALCLSRPTGPNARGQKLRWNMPGSQDQKAWQPLRSMDVGSQTTSLFSHFSVKTRWALLRTASSVHQATICQMDFAWRNTHLVSN